MDRVIHIGSRVYHPVRDGEFDIAFSDLGELRFADVPYYVISEDGKTGYCRVIGYDQPVEAGCIGLEGDAAEDFLEGVKSSRPKAK